ncbi:MAG: FG-GAP repeat domain-containing protein, partial [Bacteroidota bacterium]
MIATFTRIGRVLGVLLALLSTGASAQVTFTNQGTLLQSVPGTSVADCGADMDQDGLDDIVRVFGNGIYIDYQQPNGSFTPAFYPLTVLTSPSWSIAAADIDGNGWTDLCFGGGSRCSFVYFDGTSFVEDQDPTYIFSQRSTFCDIDNDGNLDAFVCHDVDQSHPYRNVNGILQLDQSLISTLDAGGNYAAIWCDYD